jgi:sulfatase modifying factor 1
MLKLRLVPRAERSQTPSENAVAADSAPPKSALGRGHTLVILLVGVGIAILVSGAMSHPDANKIHGPAIASPMNTPPVELTPVAVPAPVPPSCPAEMALVEGSYCSDVRQDCNRWLDDESLPFARCAEYSPRSRCVGKRVSMRFCIDRLEYTPPGEKLPQNQASFDIASKTCEGLGKRVCTDNEWTFACEGEDMLPYPYGYERRPVCNQDVTHLFEKNPHMQVLRDLREPADSHPECKSPFGVLNMTGNMDEPTAREGFEKNQPFRNALKGGWWMPSRNRCRPATTAHDDYFKDIQIGVRCCEAAPG